MKKLIEQYINRENDPNDSWDEVAHYDYDGHLVIVEIDSKGSFEYKKEIISIWEILEYLIKENKI